MQHFGASDGKIVCWLIKYVYTTYITYCCNLTEKINNLWGMQTNKSASKLYIKVNHDCHQTHQNFAYTINNS